MNNKDLFNAIQNVDENYIANAWDNTEADRPIVIRPEQRSGRKTVRNIMLGIGGTAAAAALGLAVITGANGTFKNSFFSPASGADDPDESAISYIKDKFANRKDGSDFDPNSPIPVNIIAPDGKPLTYNDLVGASINGKYYFWETGATAEDIAQMDHLFENFFDIINSTESKGGFWNTGYVYLPEPGSDTLKRYNSGDTYCGLKIGTCSSSFDKNGKYYNGDIWFERSEKLIGVEVTRTGEYDFQEKNPLTNDVSDRYHFGGHDFYGFTSSDPKLTAFTGGLDNGFIEGKIGLFTDIPLNIPVKVTIDNINLSYCADESCYCGSEEPAVTLSGIVRDFEPYDESLKQWIGKGLTVPYASAPGDFSFLRHKTIDVKWGDEIYAVDEGEVVDKRDDRITVKHGENLYTSYYYIDVSADIGDKVKAGDVIGTAYYGGESDCIFTYKFTLNQPDLTMPNLMD